MGTKPTTSMKLLLTGAFVAITSSVFGQSITAEHYEASGTQTYLMPAPFFASNVRICAQDSVKLTASSFSGSSFTWTLPDGSTSSVTTSSIWVKDQGNYSVSDGTSSSTLYVAKESGRPEIYSSSYPVTEELLQAAGSDSNKTNPGTLFSFFSSSSKQDFIAPVGKEFTYTKQQYLITSSELSAMGFTQGSTLKSLGFYFNNSWSGCNSNGFNLRINLYPTTLSSMSSTFITSGGYYIGNYGCDSYNEGWNYFDFSNSYTWDGTSDLVFDFSYYNENSSTNNPSIAIDQTTFDATTISVSPNVDLRYNWPSSAFVKSAGNYRPSMSFKYSRPALTDTIVSCNSSIQLDVKNGSGSNTYTWASTGGLSSSTSNLTVSNSDLVYLSSVSSNLCLVKDTVQVLKSIVTAPVITASSTDFCEGETVTLSTTIPSNYTASWSNASNSASIVVSSGGDYTVSLVNEYGCSKTSVKKTITEIKKPVLLKSESYVDVYANQDLPLVSASYSRTAKYFGDYAGSKYFIFRDGQDSANYADLVESAPGAEMVAIDNQGLDQWVISTHNDLYNNSSSDYPYTLQTGVKWDESEQVLKGINGIAQTYESWYNDPYTSLSQDKWFVRYYQNNTNLTWWDTDNFDNGGALISYPLANLAVQNGDVYCDSVELFAPADFTSFLWSTGETTESIWVSGVGSHSISLTGTYTKSDGTTCSLTSDTYTFTINASPSLSITNNSSTVDLTGSNYIDLEAVYSNGASILWSTGSTGDTINVYSSGDYTVTATLNGCSVTESIEVYRPLYVAKTGSDATGNGSFSNPFLTIQKGIDEASEDQKIYVLPGTYTEGKLDFETSSGSGVYKSVYLASDLVRLDDSTAIASTVIDADNQGNLVFINGLNNSKIEGFTLTGQKTVGSWNDAVFYLDNGANLKIKNCDIYGNNWNSDAQAHLLYSQYSSPEFENVTIKGHGTSNAYARRVAYIYEGSVLFKNVIWKDNYAWDSDGLIDIRRSNVSFENNLFIGNASSDERPLIGVFENAQVSIVNTSICDNSDVANNVTVNQLLGFKQNNASIVMINSLLGDMNSEQLQIDNLGGGNNNTFTSRNSVLPNLSTTTSSSIAWDVDNSNVFADPQLDTDGTLKDNSPAIGIGTKQPVTIGSTTYTPPLTDLAGVTRPDPAGSNPDAGAYESDKAQGDFDILLTQCGYLLEATVLNSNAYTVAWLYNNDTVSNSESFMATDLGSYTFYAASTDRSSTISETISLTDPLRFVMMGTKNNCTDVGSSNGYIRWGQPEGGTTNNNNNYYSWVQNSSGSYQWGGTNQQINRKADYDGYHETNSLGAGMYYVSVSDATGCTITDTIEIIDQDQDMYFVSTAGNDLNAGTSESDAWGSIEYALSQVCDEDTIIILDGTYYEDSLDVTRDLVLGSKFLLDGDTNHIANTVIDGEDDGWIMMWYGGSSTWSDTISNQLVGLTIRNGNSAGNGYAGGLTVYNSRALKVKSVRFEHNENNQDAGGAMYMRNNSYVELQDVKMHFNHANEGGAFYSYYGYSRFFDLDLNANTSNSERVAIYLNNARSFYSENVNVRNHNSQHREIISMNMWDLTSDAVLKNWVVKNNSAQARLFAIAQQGTDDKLIFENSLIVNNTTTNGGPGLLIRDARNEVAIINSTIANNRSINSANKEGGAMIVMKSPQNDPTLSIVNSVVENKFSTYTIAENNDNGFDLNIDNSFIDGGSTKIHVSSNSTLTYGTSNLSSGLYFTDAASGDYSLSSVSTLLGAGVSSATVGGISITAPTTDLYGNPRPNPSGTNPDLGAIEGVDSIAQVGIAVVVTDNGFCQTANGAITANLLNYTGTATYSWSSSTYPTWTWNATQSATSLASGDYKVVAMDQMTGAKIDSLEVTVSTTPSISIANTSTDVTCFGDDDGELTFEISGGNPLGGSQYNYSIDYLEALAQATGVVLPDNGSWFNDDNNSNSRTNKYNADDWNGNPIYQGKYYVSVSDQDGCTFTDTVVVGYDHELPQVNITTLASDGTVGLTSMCEGTGNTISLTANVTGGGGTNSFSWSNASTAQTVGVAQTDDYVVEVTDQYTCVGKDTIDIYFQSAPQLVVEGAGTPAYSGQALTGTFASNATYMGSYNGSHYYYVNNWERWETALAYAESLGGHLARPESEGEADALHQMKQQNDCCNGVYIDIHWNNNRWEYSNGEPIAFNYFNGNYQTGQGTNSGSSTRNHVEINGTYWNHLWYTDTRPFIIEFDPVDAPVTFNQAFCDSIELKATPFVSADGPGFTEIYWTDAQNDTINELEYKSFYADQDITLHGVFTRSDGQTCDIASATYSFDVNNSPNLELVALDSTYDYSGDTLEFYAYSDSANAIVEWTHDTSLDTLRVAGIGSWTVTANLNGCSVSREVFVEQPIYVAKAGSDVTGNGTLSSPYKTIQFAIDTANSGQKIFVLPGTYNENLVINKQVRLYSDVVRLNNLSAKNTTIVNAGYNGRIIEFSGNTRLDRDSTIIDGFTLKNGDTGGDSGSGLYANWTQGSGITVRNSILKNNRKSCCNDGIAISFHGVGLYLENVDIFDNGSPSNWDERMVIDLRHCISNWTNVRFRGNESNSYVIYLDNTDLNLVNCDFVGNTIQDNNSGLITLDWGSNLTMNHVTMTNNSGQGYGIGFRNNGDQKLVIYNSIISGFSQGSIKTSGSQNKVHIYNSAIDNVPASVTGNGQVFSSNIVEAPNLGVTISGSLASTSPALGLGGMDTTIAGHAFTVPRSDLAGNSRPIPIGTNPDAGAYEDSLAIGDFGLSVQNCGFLISSTVLNSSNYSVTVTGVGGFSQTGEQVQVSLKGTYLVTAVDSTSGEVLTQSVAITNPLSIGYLWSRDACASNNGIGEIVFGDFTGGVDISPTEQWFDYYINVSDSSGSYSNDWQVHQGSGSTWNASVQAGQYIVALTDGSGCSVYDTVEIEDIQGSKYYISTTGSDANTGVYTDPLATIQEALNRACDGDTIVLFDGEYFENVQILNQNLPYVTIASEYIDDGVDSHITNTIVNGMDEDPVFDISNHNSTSDTIMFVGFTITNGKSSNWYGGGGISSNYSNVALKHMVVSGNRSGHAGGGIGIDGGYLNLWHTEVSNNIADNDGGGIRANYMERLDGHGSTVIKNNKTNSNGGGISYGHGYWGSNEDFYIKGFTIENNSANSEGGGLHINNWGNNNGELLIENIKILNNRSIYNNSGGMYINHNGEDAVMKNVIIASNRSNNTGGLTINDVDLNIVHSTIYANPVLDGTSSNDQITLENNSNVLFLNSAVGGQTQVGNSVAHTFYFNDYDTTCDLTIASSIVQGGANSIDNPYNSTVAGTPIGQPLYLVNPSQGDYMLSPVSQGLGAAVFNYVGVTMPYLDIEGTARPNPTGSNPDVGAVESPLDSAEFGAAYIIRNNIACDPTYGRLKVTPLNGSGSYRYELDDLTGSATFSNQQNVSSYTYSSLYSGDYLVTITDLFDSSTFKDTVTISGKDSLGIILDYNDEFCSGENNGAISIRVTGGDGYYDYTWSTTTNSNWPKSNNLNNLYPDQYFVTVKDGDNCFVQDSVTINTLHQLPLVSITGNINKAGTITQTTNSIIRACAGDLVSLDAGAGYIDYNWSTEDQLNSWTTQTLSASYEESFYVTVIDTFGCSNTDSVEIFYVQRPSIFASNVNTSLGSAYQQVTSYIEGSNQFAGFNSEPKPYGANDKFAKMQFIIPANELISEGLTDQTTINSLGFEVEIASGSPVQNFKIKLKNTTSNQLNSNFETGLTEVYDFNLLTAGEGWNTHDFDKGFIWDGTKNLLVQVEYSNVAFNNGSNTFLVGHSTSYTSSNVTSNYSSSVANQTTGNTFTWRPNMKLGIDKVQATDTLRVCDFTMLNTTDDYDTYSWLIDGTSSGTQLRYALNTQEEVVLKTVDAASSCTMYSDTVQVLLDATPRVFVTNNSLSGCIGDSVSVGVDTVDKNVQYLWSNGTEDTLAYFNETGSYYLYGVSPSGCRGIDTVNVAINIPPDIAIELNGRVLTATDGSVISSTSSCDTSLLLPYVSQVDSLSELNSSEWSTYSSQFLKWEFNQGWDSLIDYTGPIFDADSNYHGGFYQFDPASITDQGKVGYLGLGCINLVGMSDPTIEFSYHMVDVYADSSNTSDQMGSLAFEVKESSDDSWTILWQRSGTDPSYTWNTKNINLSNYVNQTIQVRWKATAGVGGPRTEMAIDNVIITDSLASLSNISGRLTPETVCEGDSLYATTISNDSANYTYQWNNGESTKAIELTQTGWYGVTVTDDKGCAIITDSVFIEVNQAPNSLITVSDTTQYCFGQFDSLTIAVTAGYEDYQWSVNQGLISNSSSLLQVDSLSIGTTDYFVQITDSMGCKSTTEIVSLVHRDNPSLQLTVNPLLCNSDSSGMIDLSVSGNGGYSYNWDSNNTSEDLSGLSAGWYTVTVLDSFSCTSIDSVQVLEPTPVALSQVSIGDVLCYGGSDGFAEYTFTGGVGGYQFTWTDSSLTWSSDSLNLTNASAGIYILKAEDSNACALFDTVVIAEPADLIITLDSTTNLSCYQSSDGKALASAVGGFGSYGYYLDGYAVNSLSDTTLTAGSHTFAVIDGNGCSDSVVFTLTEPQQLQASSISSEYLGGVNISCNGASDGFIDVTVTGGTLPYSYTWADGDTTEDRAALTASSYALEIKDANGCEVSISDSLIEPTQVITTSNVTDLNCFGANDGEINYAIIGGISPYISSWSGSSGAFIDSVYVTFQVDMQGATLNSGGIQLVSNSGMSIPMNLVPVLEDSIYRASILVANGSTIQYRFFNGSTPETVPNNCGSNVSGTFYREVQISSDTTIAANIFSSCVLTNSSATGALISSGRKITGLIAGIYTMNISDINGCGVTLSDTLMNPDSLYVSAVSISEASCPQTPDGTIDVTISGGTSPYTYNWSSGDTTEDIMGTYGYYDLIVTDAKGCIDSSTYLIDAPFPYNDEEVCVVTVDTTGVNLIVWEKTPGKKTASYEIFRENASTQYVSVGSNQYMNMSTWADQNSNPAVQPYRYKIAVVDSCGNYSDTSDYHATIHLQASQGVAANEVNLQWTAYEGKQVQTYYIYRWLNPSFRVLVDSVSSSVQTYTDIYPVNTTLTALLYEVGAKFVNGGCSPSAGKQSGYATSMSNMIDWGQDGGLPIGTEEWINNVLDHDMSIYPNPTRNILNLELSGEWSNQRDIMIRFTDLTGRIVESLNVQGDGTYQFDFAQLPAGVYFIQVITAEGRTIVKRFERIN